VNDHTTAIVPIETWVYQSPELRQRGVRLDIGLLAEALIYYDRVFVIPETAPVVGRVFGPNDASPPDDVIPAPPRSTPPFVELVGWFEANGRFTDFLALLSEGVLNVYHYAFRVIPLMKDGRYVLVNAQYEGDESRATFMQRVAGHESLKQALPRARRREQLYRRPRCAGTS
jgi:hypothetical protein